VGQILAGGPPPGGDVDRLQDLGTSWLMSLRCGMQTERFMRVAIAQEQGKPPRLSSRPRPEPRRGEALLRVQASGVNPLDLKILAGAAAHARQPLPAVLGLDLAGIVLAVGPAVSNVRVGDQVFGMTGGVGGLPGSLAEYAAVDAALLAIRPSNLSAREAASVPLVFITAWEGLVDRAHIRPGESVLIHGGAGGVGHSAVQIAAAHGAKVFATGSPASRAYIEHLGATFIDYRSEPVSEYVGRLTDGKGFDVVYDTVGGSTLDSSFAAVRRFGHVVSSLGWGTHLLAPLSFRAASYSGVFTLLPLLTGEGRAHHAEILQEATNLVMQGKFAPRVDPREFSLESIAEAV
jgi:NADPH2:quinone reductase